MSGRAYLLLLLLLSLLLWLKQLRLCFIYDHDLGISLRIKKPEMTE
jgi:hypothetical protein